MLLVFPKRCCLTSNTVHSDAAVTCTNCSVDPVSYLCRYFSFSVCTFCCVVVLQV